MFNLVRRQCRRLALYRMVLPVRNRIQPGTGRFCLAFLPRTRLIRNVLIDGYNEKIIKMTAHKQTEKGKRKCVGGGWMDG